MKFLLYSTGLLLLSVGTAIFFKRPEVGLMIAGIGLINLGVSE